METFTVKIEIMSLTTQLLPAWKTELFIAGESGVSDSIIYSFTRFLNASSLSLC